MTSARKAAGTAALLAALAALAGCSRQATTICASEGDYLGASTAPPLRIPDDLTVPDESNALRIPEIDVAPTTASDGCLDAPPLYSDAPGAISSAEEPSRRERRRERRAAREAEEAREAAESPDR